MTTPKTSGEITIAVMTKHADKEKLWLPADDYNKLKALYDNLMENFKRMDENTIPKERVEEYLNKRINKIRELIKQEKNPVYQIIIVELNELNKILLKGEK